MKKYTKETFYKEAELARIRFSENYEGKDILDIGNWETAQYCDYFMQEFHSGSVVGFSNWEHEDYFCTWYSDVLEKIIVIDSDAYVDTENWEDFVQSLWEYQEEAQELEERLKKENNITKKIKIFFSEEDLQELLQGKSFDWNYDGVDVHLEMGENEE